MQWKRVGAGPGSCKITEYSNANYFLTIKRSLSSKYANTQSKTIRLLTVIVKLFVRKKTVKLSERIGILLCELHK